jgi:hypothetical protein
MSTRRIPTLSTAVPGMLAGLAVLFVTLTPTLAAASGDLPPGPGSLTVEKTVEGPGHGPFGFHVFCPGGDAPLLDESFQLEAGGSKTFTDLAPGTECTVEETDAGGAASTKVTPADGTAVIPEDDEAIVSFVNVFPAATTTTTSTTTTTLVPTTTTTTAAPTTTTTMVPTVLGEVLVAPAAELPRTGSSGPRRLGTAGFAMTAIGVLLVSLMNLVRRRRTVGAKQH